jgi:hypothetical protein
MKKKKKVLIQNITDLKPGDDVQLCNLTLDVMSDGRKIATYHVVHDDVKVLSVDDKEMMVSVQFPDGTTGVIEWVEFLIFIIPKAQDVVCYHPGFYS